MLLAAGLACLLGSPAALGAPARVAAAQRRGLGSGTAATGRRNGPSALPLQNETAPDRLVRSPRLVQGRSMEPSREVEAWVESYCFLVSYWR